MEHEVQHRAETIRVLADKHEAQCGDLLKETRYTDISPDAFMLYGFDLATAYAVMTEWANQDLKALVEKLHDVRQKLHVVAQRRDGAEAASILKV